MASVRARAMFCVLAVVAAAMLPGVRPRLVAQAQVTLEVGMPFALIDQNGRPFSSEALAGLPYAIFFGFTNCPDVCPTTLLEMSNHLAALGPDGDRLKVVFVSVDPSVTPRTSYAPICPPLIPASSDLRDLPSRLPAPRRPGKPFTTRFPRMVAATPSSIPLTFI
jgi:SCO1/SenC